MRKTLISTLNEPRPPLLRRLGIARSFGKRLYQRFGPPAKPTTAATTHRHPPATRRCAFLRFVDLSALDPRLPGRSKPGIARAASAACHLDKAKIHGDGRWSRSLINATDCTAPCFSNQGCVPPTRPSRREDCQHTFSSCGRIPTNKRNNSVGQFYRVKKILT